MVSIIYRGVTYREVVSFLGSHKKCKNGTHWNEKSRSCQKVSENLQSKMNAAHEATRLQKDEEGRRYVNHEKHHLDARDKHQEAAKTAKEEGFHKLSKEHTNLAKKHDDAVSAIYEHTRR